jgi:hypothetical protein
MLKLSRMLLLASLVACGGAPEPKTAPPQKTVFDAMTRQEKELPARVEAAQAAHVEALRKAETEQGDGR